MSDTPTAQTDPRPADATTTPHLTHPAWYVAGRVLLYVWIMIWGIVTGWLFLALAIDGMGWAAAVVIPTTIILLVRFIIFDRMGSYGFLYLVFHVILVGLLGYIIILTTTYVVEAGHKAILVLFFDRPGPFRLSAINADAALLTGAIGYPIYGLPISILLGLLGEGGIRLARNYAKKGILSLKRTES